MSANPASVVNPASVLAKAHDLLMAAPSTVASLQMEHQAELERLFRALDRSSRIGRFNHFVSDAHLIAHARTILYVASWVAGAFSNGRLRGVVEAYNYAELGFAELAFAVEPGWCTQGIGSTLLRAATDWAAGSNVPMLRMVFARSNLAMQKLVVKADARIGLMLDEMTADIELRCRHSRFLRDGEDRG